MKTALSVVIPTKPGDGPLLIGPVLPCQALAAPAKTLLPCGLKKITLIEHTFDQDNKPGERTVSEAVPAPQAMGHKPLTLKFAMTAPAQGGALPGKLIDLKRESTGGCGSTAHSTWVVEDQTKGAEHTHLVFSDKSAATVLKEKAQQARANAAAAMKSGKMTAVEGGIVAAGSAAGLAAVRGFGLDLAFDSIMRTFTSRRHYSFYIGTCGNPATETTRSGLVDVVVYPSERYKFVLSLPSLAPVEEYSGRDEVTTSKKGKKKTKKAGWEDDDDNPGFSFSVDDQDHETSVDFSNILKAMKQAEDVKQKVKNAIKVIPKGGFWIDGDIKFLFGEVSLSWQWVEDDDRSVYLEWKFAGSLTFIEAAIEFNLGANFLWYEVKVSLKITGTLAVSRGLTGVEKVDAPSQPKTLQIAGEGSVVGVVGVTADVGVVNVFGGFKSAVEVEAGFKFPIGDSQSSGQQNSGRSAFYLEDAYFGPVIVVMNIKSSVYLDYTREFPVADKKFKIFDGIE